MRLNFLRFVYKSLLAGMPFMTYNPITQNPFNVPIEIKPYSTYINFKLSEFQTDYLNNYISKYTDELTIVPIALFPQDEKSNYLSVNVYNCSSPVFLNNYKDTTRCEINTYVKDKKGNYGTLIIDYLSNELSMDPVNIFKNKDFTDFLSKDNFKTINCQSISENITLNLNFSTIMDKKNKLSDSLIKYTDKIFYRNGIFDKLYYDSTLVDADVRIPRFYFNFSFHYKELNFENADSIFFFKNPINFIGSMWYNLNNITELKNY